MQKDRSSLAIGEIPPSLAPMELLELADKIVVRKDLLDETDGPMLQYGIKGLHNTTLFFPRSKDEYPKQEYLDWRFERFKKAG